MYVYTPFTLLMTGRNTPDIALSVRVSMNEATLILPPELVSHYGQPPGLPYYNKTPLIYHGHLCGLILANRYQK